MISRDALSVAIAMSSVPNETRVVPLDVLMRIDIVQAVARRLQLASSHVAGPVQQLTMEVGGVDHVEVDQAEGADAGRGEVERHL